MYYYRYGTTGDVTKSILLLGGHYYTVKPSMRYHCDGRLTSHVHCLSSNKALHFCTFVPVVIDHLSYKTNLVIPLPSEKIL